MDVGAIVSVITQAGGYAALCVLLVIQLRDESKAHREEVTELSGVIRDNTATVAALLEHLKGAGA